MNRQQLQAIYADIVPALDFALTDPKGVHFPCDSYSQAIRLQQRVRKFLKHHREAESTASPYATLYSPNIEKGETKVQVLMRVQTFTTADGDRIKVTPKPAVPATTPVSDEDLELAKQVRQNLGLDVKEK